jgi:hypothetical protein
MKNKENFIDNELLKFFDPPPGYTSEEIISLKIPAMIELDFWRKGERFKAIKIYAKRNKLQDKIELVAWYFLSMNLLANKILREQEKFLNTKNPNTNPLDPSDV